MTPRVASVVAAALYPRRRIVWILWIAAAVALGVLIASQARLGLVARWLLLLPDLLFVLGGFGALLLLDGFGPGRRFSRKASTKAGECWRWLIAAFASWMLAFPILLLILILAAVLRSR
jgi:hypothetical protein